MDWTRRCIDDAGAWQARRPISTILAVAAVVLLAVAGAGCGHSAEASNIAAGGNGSDCPTQGVGGDTLAPPCPSPAEGSSSAKGIPGPQGPGTSGSGTPPAAPSPDISGPETVSASPTGPGISGPETITATPAPPPQVTGISPASGAAAGGDSVTISGSGFTGATEVDFGGVSAAITAISDTAITVTSPPGSGTVDITVVTPNGTSSAGPADQFSYSS